MRTAQMSPKYALVGVFGLVLGACSADGGSDGGSRGGSPANPAGGSPAAGGTQSSSGGASSGGASKGGESSGGSHNNGGSLATGGKPASGGAPNAFGGTSASGGSAMGGSSARGGSTSSGGAKAAGGASSGGSSNTAGTTGSGTCTASKPANSNASGSGPHKVTVETNSDSGIKEGTIFRPTDLGGTEKYPIFVWGEGGCSRDGLSNAAAMGEIASHGYFVVADGNPGGGSENRPMDAANPVGMAKPLIAYIDWAIAENEKPCSAYYHSLDTTKIASNGFSCGGLMAEGTAGDKRITTWGINSSGLTGSLPSFYKTVHTPVLIVLGGSGDVAYKNGKSDYTSISALGVPVMLFSKALGHGGDLFSSRGGDFTKIDLAWLNWWLKGDETATGKGVLVGSGCKYCTDSAWEVMSANIP